MSGYLLGFGTTFVGNWGGDTATICRVPIPRGSIALLLATDGFARFGSATVVPGGAAMAAGGADVELYTSSGFFGLLVAVEEERWRELLDSCGIDVRLTAAEIRVLGDASIDYAPARSLAVDAMRVAEDDPERFSAAGQAGGFEEEFLRQIVGTLDPWREPFRPQPVRLPARQRAALRARDYIEGNLQHPLTLATVCRESCSSARALEYAFRELFGLSPMAYAKRARLTRVRRDLLSAAAGVQSVTGVATRWGFWHLGQFSRDYRMLFAERPSVTLARVPGRSLPGDRPS